MIETILIRYEKKMLREFLDAPVSIPVTQGMKDLYNAIVFLDKCENNIRKEFPEEGASLALRIYDNILDLQEIYELLGQNEA